MAGQRTIYHVADGPVTMYDIDAVAALKHKGWSAKPWSVEDQLQARRDAQQRRADNAKAQGLPEPEPVDVNLTDAQRAELDDDAKRRSEAADRLAVYEKEENERKARDTQAAADRALLASPPPQLEPVQPTAADSGPVEIPADWKSLSIPRKRALAIKLGAPTTVTGEQADARIDAEVARRASAASAASKPAA